MDIHAELKYDLHKMIDQINDERLLQAVYVILEKKQEDFYDELSPAVKASIERGLNQIKNGQTIPHEEVRKRYAKWLK